MQMGIFPKKSVHDHQFHIGFFQDCLGKFIGIFPFEHNTLDARIHQHFRTDDTGLQGDIDGRTFCADTDLCCLNDGVLLCVYGIAQLMACAGGDVELAAHAFALFGAALYAGGCAVVAGGEYALILDYYRADMAVFLIAAGPAADGPGQFYEALVPLCPF